MNAIIINGSARGIKGITHRLLEAFEKGLTESNWTVRSYNLKELNIEHCKSCFHCMHNNPGICIIKDDMDGIYEELKSSDLLVIGTPLYLDNMTARMKVFFDRCIPSMQPFIHKDKNGRFRHSFIWRMPRKFVLISTSGFPEAENFKSLEATVKAQAYNFDSELAASLRVPGSLGLQMEISLLEPHLELIYQSGRQFGTEQKIPKELVERINTPVLTGDEFYKRYLKYEEWCRKRLLKTDNERF